MSVVQLMSTIFIAKVVPQYLTAGEKVVELAGGRTWCTVVTMAVQGKLTTKHHTISQVTQS
jgi:hypothetical protein